MSLSDLLVRDVTVQTAVPTIDRYNNSVLDWTSPSETSAKAWVTQTGARENHEQRDAVVDTVLATFPPDTPIGPYDRVVIDGLIYEIDGEPAVRWTPRGPHHLEVQLQAVRG